ncbi:hypothetical protein TWF694_011362 [Orbilia ellipsospora]|uniref:Extracellular membrane protein CFEM domain-containing protein n=1 Tax=Orbilia ellipsospora TaxID=2528407 RepID=A0AAV9X697_9PEZI
MLSQTKLALFFLPLACFRPAGAQGGGDTVTIFTVGALTSARPCATSCLTEIGRWIGCPSSPLVNSCFCRTDLTDIATSSITSYVSQWCNGGISMDAQVMTSVYTSYCLAYYANANIDVGPASNTAKTTSPNQNAGPVTQTSVKTTIETITTQIQSVVTQYTGTVTTKVQSQVTEVILSTFTTVLTDETLQKFASEYKQGSGLEKGYQVAIAVGVIAIVIIIILLFMNKIRRRWFGYTGPTESMPQPPMGGIEGAGLQQNLGPPQHYNQYR